MTDAHTPTLRPTTPADRELLLRVYAATREDELRAVPWTEEQKTAFLEHQFTAQDTHYRTNLPDVSYDVVECDGTPIGRLYVGRWPHELRVVDIAILPEHRGRGIGAALLRDVAAEARAAGKTVTVHVECGNRARTLYERLGFREVASPEGNVQDVYVLMKLDPARA